jgi:hypothetical protein
MEETFALAAISSLQGLSASIHLKLLLFAIS